MGYRHVGLLTAVLGRLSRTLESAGTPDVFPPQMCVAAIYASAQLNHPLPESFSSPSMMVCNSHARCSIL